MSNKQNLTWEDFETKGLMKDIPKAQREQLAAMYEIPLNENQLRKK